MYRVAKLSETDRRVLFLNTAEKMGMHPAIVEKDFWVCLVLDYLFHQSKWKDAFIFKGGTSLSKAYHLIQRFSEDVDLILDWRLIHYGETEPWEERSKTQQDKLNKKMNQAAQLFLENDFVKISKSELAQLLGFIPDIAMDDVDDQTVNFHYPHIFGISYLRPEIRLEVGPLAEWMPNHEEKITSYAAELYGGFFEKTHTMIKTVDVERTFWEKATILHKVANRNTARPFPTRYARHYYDLYCMYNSDVKLRAFQKKELLERDIIFKKKFYSSNNAGYDTAKIGTMKLLPQTEDEKALLEDYLHMKNMFYGKIPEFGEILDVIKRLEDEINALK